jgi:hypothetical protein
VRSASAAGLRCVGVGPAGERLLRAGALAAVAGLDEVREIAAGLVAGAPGRVLRAARIEVTAALDETVLDDDTAARVAACWTAARAERPSLTDGEIVTLRGIERADVGGGGGGLRVRAGLSRYRLFVAQRRGVALGLRPLGVTAITLLHVPGSDGAPLLVLGRRSARVTQYPGCWELVPSGGVARERVAPGGAVDVAGQLREELEEELGVAPARVLAMTPLGIVEDLADRVVDVAFRLDVEGEPAALEAHVAAHAEYDALAFAPLADVLSDRFDLRALAGEAGLVPTVAPLVEMLAGRI